MMRKLQYFGVIVIAMIAIMVRFGMPYVFAHQSGNTGSASSSFNLNNLPGTNLTVGGINNMLINASQWLFYFAGLIAVAMIIFYGIRYMTANGDEKVVESAQKGLKYAIIGLVVVLLAWTMIALLGNILGNSAPVPTYQSTS